MIKINHDDLYTEKLKQLIHIVTYRGEMVNRATFKERNDGTFQPYKLSNEINNIEKDYKLPLSAMRIMA